jgi:restriction system protein
MPRDWISDADLYEREERKERSAQHKQSAVATTQWNGVRIDVLENLLRTALDVSSASWFSWPSSDFRSRIPKPQMPKLKAPKQSQIPREPQIDDADYQPVFDVQDRLSWEKRDAKNKQAAARFAAAHDTWQARRDQLVRDYEKKKAKYEESVKSATAEYRLTSATWEARREAYQHLAEFGNMQLTPSDVDTQGFIRKTVESYASDVLTNAALAANLALSEPQRFLQLVDKTKSVQTYGIYALSDAMVAEYRKVAYDSIQAQVMFDTDNGMLVVNCKLPEQNDISPVTERVYVQTSDSFREKRMTDAKYNKLYESVLYQVTLLCIHNLFLHDNAGVLRGVGFNGFVKAVDRRTGHRVENCILSVVVPREAFVRLDLMQVDAKACFLGLKGVAGLALHDMTPVPPLLQYDMQDRRFVAGLNVVDSLATETNLALMDWKLFEHLIRELFEKVYAKLGSEVKVTRATRDYGVDAVAFDPDPIRGGKIVIQAKRYTNTVDVAAVRDLYGTVHNEGAMKGILVTTSDFGPDAHAFATGKPLTLLNGNNLLCLLGEHGYSMRIDLEEARAVNRAARP